MVMDATQPQQPSPQSVGREFVRQYYTLLNKAPNHLHRFYNNNSSFIHGESTLVVGQKNIHNRIQQLNFHDCHAKISQVDAQATLGNGVVVQVTGELSNDGQPMRRFTQTFVLAAQSPKKYYVHNDIFRYQDMYSDEDNDGESRSENDDEREQATPTPNNEQQSVGQLSNAVVADQHQQQQQNAAQLVANANTILQQAAAAAAAAAAGTAGAGQPGNAAAQQQQAIYFSMPATAGARPMAVLAAATPQGNAPVPMGATYANTGAAPPPPQQQQQQQQQQQVQGTASVAAQLNGVIAHDDMLSVAAAAGGIQQSSATQQQQQPPPPLAGQNASSVVQSTAVSTGVNTAVQTANGGVTAIPVANVPGLLQNSATAIIASFQQTSVALLQQQNQHSQQSLMQHQQQQPQPQPQQQQTSLTSVSTQHSLPTQTPPLVASSQNVEIEEKIISQTITNSNEIVSSRANAALQTVPEPPVTAAPIVDDFKTINEQQQQEKYESAKQQNEPKTYANLFKSSSSSPSGFVNTAMQHNPMHQTTHATSGPTYSSSLTGSTYSQTTAGGVGGHSSMSSYGNRNGETSNSSSLRMDNNSSNLNQAPLPQRSNLSRTGKDFDQRRTSNSQQFGDNHQLFLGNIPHNATEEELKPVFSRFGNVLELRILSKPGGGKMVQGVRNPLNYGFITYEDPESVQNCLAHGPIYYPEGSPDAQKLNVEEKKPRMRMNDLPPRQSMGGGGGGGGNNMNNNMNNSQRNMGGGGPASRSLSGGGGGGGSGMMRGNNSSNNMNRGNSGGGGGPRMGNSFGRNDNRSGGGPSNGPQMRNNNSQSGGGNYGGRR